MIPASGGQIGHKAHRPILVAITLAIGVLFAYPTAGASAAPIHIDSVGYDLTNNPRHWRFSDLELSDTGAALNQAGGHSNLFVHVDYCALTIPNASKTTVRWNCAEPRSSGPVVNNIIGQVPTGMFGAAANVAVCNESRIYTSRCKQEMRITGLSNTSGAQEETSWPNTASKIGYSGTITGGGLPANSTSNNIIQVDFHHSTTFDEPARLGIDTPVSATAFRHINNRDDTDVGLDTTFLDLDEAVSAIPDSFNRQTENVCAQVGCPDNWIGDGPDAGVEPDRGYYWTNSTACYKLAKLDVKINTKQDSTYSAKTDTEPITDCNPLITAQNLTAAKPSVEITPQDGSADDAVDAGQGSGYQVAINVPEHLDLVDSPGTTDDANFTENPDAAHRAPRVSSHTYRVETKLPEGVTFSNNAAKKLQGCTNEQFGIDPVESADYAPGGPLDDTVYDPNSANFDPAFTPLRGDGESPNCPAASQIGTAKVYVPLADGDPTTPNVYMDPVDYFNPLNGTKIPGGHEPLEGRVYFAQPDQPGAPTAANPWYTFVAIDDIGVHVKLRGETYLENGRIVSIFDRTPQTPFTRFELEFNGGADSVLQAPRTCGTKTMEMKIFPWAGATATAPEGNPGRQVLPPAGSTAETVADSFQTINCTDSFTPAASGYTSPKTAGAFTESVLNLDRPDQDDYIKNLQIKLPPGLVGSLTVPQCEIADLEADNCPQNTKVGKVTAKVGTGGSPLSIDGSLYLAKPSAPGDVATVASVIPAKVGPIDLGPPVITKNHVTVDPTTAALTVVSDDIPASRDGILLPVKQIAIDVNRSGFFRNATSCDLAQASVTFTSQDPDNPADTKTHTSSFSDAATDCDKLAFSPQLKLVAGSKSADQTAARNRPTLKATVTQAEGQGNIKTARVVLPDALRPDTKNVNKPGVLCTPAQFAASACPPSSIAGRAVAHSPLLPDAIAGDVYLIQRSVGALPDLSIQLRGQVAINLLASNAIKVPNTVNTFDAVPDVPQTSFELTIDGGPNSILMNFFDLCTGLSEKSKTGDATFTSHSGAVYHSNPKLEILGCERFDGQALIKSLKLKKAKAKKKTKKSTTAKKKAKKTAATVVATLSCPGKIDCAGKLVIKGALKRKGKPTSKIGSRKYEVLAGSTETVELRLPRKAQRALTKLKRLKLKGQTIPTTSSRTSSFNKTVK